jgi:CRP-like cAMP-binding protein
MNLHSEAIEAALNELAAFSIFEGLSKDQILDLCQGGQIVTCAHRDFLFRCGDPATFFGLVLSGACKLSRPSLEGEDVIMNFTTAGDLVGAFILTQPNSIYPVSATSIGPSRFLKLPKETYLIHWKRHPEFIFKVQEQLAARLCLLQDQKALNKAPLMQKVAVFLMTLFKRNPSELGFVNPPLTRKEIAEALGSSVESVIRIMSDWSKQGFIRTEGRQVQILQPEKILELAALRAKSK